MFVLMIIMRDNIYTNISCALCRYLYYMSFGHETDTFFFFFLAHVPKIGSPFRLQYNIINTRTHLHIIKQKPVFNNPDTSFYEYLYYTFR